MRSEKRRQSQRVRHEAGESVALPSDTYSTNEQIEADHRTDSKHLPTDVVDKALKTTCLVESRPRPNPTSDQKLKLKDLSSISNEKNLSYKNKSSNKGGSRGRRDGHQVQNVEKISHIRNVVYEEKKEYEPVKVMPSSDISEIEITNMKKYRRRDVVSNWLRYEELPPEDFTVDGEDYLIGEDFSTVLKLHGNASTGGFLHLKGEMSWGDVNPSHLGMHGLGALKVADLAAALATIPLHQQLKIPEKSLPLHDIQMYNSDAESNKKSYHPDKEYVTDIDINEAILKNLKLSVSDTFNPAEKAVDDDQNFLNANDALSSVSIMPSDNSGNEFFLESTLEQGSDPTVTAKNKFINGKDIKVVCPALKPDEVPLVSNEVRSIKSEISLTVCVPTSELKDSLQEGETKASSFNFRLPSKTEDECVVIKPVAHPADLNNISLVEPESINKNEIQVKEIADPKVMCDSKEVDGNILIKILEPKINEPITLVSKTEMENLEDWLDSILDD